MSGLIFDKTPIGISVGLSRSSDEEAGIIYFETAFKENGKHTKQQLTIALSYKPDVGLIFDKTPIGVSVGLSRSSDEGAGIVYFETAFKETGGKHTKQQLTITSGGGTLDDLARHSVEIAHTFALNFLKKKETHRLKKRMYMRTSLALARKIWIIRWSHQTTKLKMAYQQ
ncbi:hypothetical protein niasHT_035164 [Heterodera trifolii]|uniref:Uncharacterized protein n=1 Tax=Heterodera trifolii TaxID=157864 RepID=A0ABD2J597_9BILA